MCEICCNLQPEDLRIIKKLKMLFLMSLKKLLACGSIASLVFLELLSP